jgi:hypothetical protein
MAKLYHPVGILCWFAAMLCVIGSLVFKIVPSLNNRMAVTPRGILMLAAVLFLGAIASRNIAEPPAK